MRVRRTCSPAWFVWDPCGFVCAFIGYFIVVYSEFVFVCRLVLPWYSYSAAGVGHILAFGAIGFMAILSQVTAMCSDPGSVPLAPYTPPEFVPEPRSDEVGARPALPTCSRCDTLKMRGMHHCSTCKHCIRRMDHHCPWINNCCGAFNQKFFILYLFYVFVLCFYAVVMSIARGVYCNGRHWRECHDAKGEHDSAATTMLLVGLMDFCAFVFGLFVLTMFLEQVCNIQENTTGIDKMKARAGIGPKRIGGGARHEPTFMESMSEVFGEEPALTWFLPILRHPVAVRQRAMMREVMANERGGRLLEV